MTHARERILHLHCAGCRCRDRLQMQAPQALHPDSAPFHASQLPYIRIDHHRDDSTLPPLRRSVVAACRNPDAAEQLHALLGEHPGRLSLVSMDVTDEASIQVSVLHAAHYTSATRSRSK